MRYLLPDLRQACLLDAQEHQTEGWIGAAEVGTVNLNQTLERAGFCM
jgi:hypothetical protein